MEDPWADGVVDEETRWIDNQRKEMHDEDFTFCDSIKETADELHANLLREVIAVQRRSAAAAAPGSLVCRAHTCFFKPVTVRSSVVCGARQPCQKR